MDVMQSHAVKLARRALAEYQQPDDTPRQNGAGYVVVLLAILSLVSIVIIGLVCDFILAMQQPGKLSSF